MAKKKSESGISVGESVRVRDGIASPEFPDIPIQGWTGTAVEITGRGADKKVIVEWDDQTQSAMPPEYKQRCEAQQLYIAMACLALDQVEPLKK